MSWHRPKGILKHPMVYVGMAWTIVLIRTSTLKQKFGFNKNKSNVTVITFLQQIQCGKLLLILIWA